MKKGQKKQAYSGKYVIMAMYGDMHLLPVT